MNLGVRILMLTMFLITGCSRPRYVTPENRLSGQSLNCMQKFSTGDWCVDLKWETRPAVGEYASFTLVVTNSAGDLVNTSVVPFVELYMPDHKHPSTPVDVTQIGTGMYRAEHGNFFMVGHWEIRVQLRNGEQVLDQVVWDWTL